MLDRSVGHTAVDHRLPFDQRWGGWYVTGRHGPMGHMGNVDVGTLGRAQPPVNTLTSLGGKLDMTGYLSSHSDIAALMVFEHQMHGMNLLSRIGWEARVAAYQDEQHQESASPVEPPTIPVREAAREVVDYLLFVEEAPLTGAVQGSTTFAEGFAAQGPRDHQGRSLRQLDLNRRLFRYPCSFLVYTEQFERLPPRAKDAIFQRMWQILSGQERDRRYSRLTFEDRKAIVEILRDTRKDLPPYFRFVTR
jgi:hypothetical protein